MSAAAVGAVMLIRELVVCRREGGRGNESAALKVWVVERRRVRTWRRVRR